MMTLETVDALVVGAGPAGLAAALALRAKGLKVIVVDQKKPYIDKACGEGLMPDALASLSMLGIAIDQAQSAPFRGIRFSDQFNSVSAQFPNGVGLGVRRTTLHKLLASHARERCIEILWETKPRIIDAHNVELGDRVVRTRWLIGADGQVSPVRKRFSLDRYTSLETRYGLRRHIDLVPWTDHVEVHWAKHGQMYVTPVSSHEVCFAFVGRNASLPFDKALIDFPELQKRIGSKKGTSEDLGSITTTRRLMEVTSGNVALIGDASGSVDAITGEGMAMSFRQAEALANAICRSDLRQYERAHRAILRLPTIMASTLLLMDRHPKLRERALAVLSENTEVFSNLLSAHVGGNSLWRVAFEHGPSLGWKLVRTSI